MGRYLNRAVVLLLVIGFSSCQRNIDLSINHPSSLLVIEGNVTNILGVQIVTVSTTIPYNKTNVFPPVIGAFVTLSDGEKSYVMSANDAEPGKYTIPNFKGVEGRIYTLSVKMDTAEVYTATSVMPKQVKMDSIGINALSVGSKIIRTVSVYYHDPPTQVNQYKFVLFVNGVQVKHVFTLDDSHSNGRVINTSLYQNDIEIKSNDRVDVEMQCIDAAAYKYWYTLGQQNDNSPSNSATPTNPDSNLSGDVLGYFSAHTAERKTLIVP